MKIIISIAYSFVTFLLATNHANACNLANSSIVYFKLFSTQTYLPVSKKDFIGGKLGGKMVIKNTYFKDLLESSKTRDDERFFEDIRMTVNYQNQIYFINTSGQIELNNNVVGKFDKPTRDHLDKGYELYEWDTCKPMNEVLNKMLERR